MCVGSPLSTRRVDKMEPAATQSPDMNEDERPQRKKTKYLREIDRRAILERLARGETQSSIANEYGVTRAAISHLHRHRDKVTARPFENMYNRHPKRRRNPLSSKAEEKSRTNRVHVVETIAMGLRLSVMADEASSDHTFRRAGGTFTGGGSARQCAIAAINSGCDGRNRRLWSQAGASAVCCVLRGAVKPCNQRVLSR